MARPEENILHLVEKAIIAKQNSKSDLPLLLDESNIATMH